MISTQRLLTIAALTLSTTFADAQTRGQTPVGPTINVQYKNMNLMGGPSTKDVDCGQLIALPSAPKTFLLSCAFYKSADNNSQDICTNTDWLPANPVEMNKVISAVTSGQTAALNPAQAAAYNRALAIAKERGSSVVQQQDVERVVQGDMTTAAIAAMKHFAMPTGHNTCKAAAGNLLTRTGHSSANVDALVGGPAWRSGSPASKECPLQETLNRCIAARNP